MRKVIPILFLVLSFSVACSNKNSSKQEVETPKEKYTQEQALKAYKDMYFGMDVKSILELGYVSEKDTSKWVIDLKYKNIGHEEFEDANIMTYKNKLFMVNFHSYVDGLNNALDLLNGTKEVFSAKYGTPEIENNINKDSIEIDKDYIVYLWNIRNKQISGKLNKSGQDDMYFVDVFIEDTITRYIKDSVALSYQSKDI